MKGRSRGGAAREDAEGQDAPEGRPGRRAGPQQGRRGPRDVKPSRPEPYHHGDLRRALVAAAEQVLAERGVAGFTLRECARRAGVSHAAPAHHFGDVTGLLTAVAVLGFETLAACMREARAGIADPAERLRAIGRGYVAFARRYPERFRLTFSSSRLDADDPALQDAGKAAFAELETAIRLLAGAGDAPLEGDLLARVVSAWSLVHGFSHLLLEGQFDHAVAKGGEAAVERLLAGLLSQFSSQVPMRP